MLGTIDLAKDADGFLPENIGRMCLRGGSPPYAISCTPAGCVELLQRSGYEVSGKTAVVLGRSNIVGMPVAHLLQSMDATVTVCHSRTKVCCWHNILYRCACLLNRSRSHAASASLGLSSSER